MSFVMGLNPMRTTGIKQLWRRACGLVAAVVAVAAISQPAYALIELDITQATLSRCRLQFLPLLAPACRKTWQDRFLQWLQLT